jgi:polyhydroxyalkanoate synthesis repressor PhaR
MVRLIKRYESRKLYDTEDSRYVSLEELAELIRRGEDVKVVDNATTDDVTTQTLTQVILEEGRRGRSKLPSELLHALVRSGGQAISSGVGQVQQGVDRFVQASLGRLTPLRQVREEMERLRSRLEELESSLAELEAGEGEEDDAEST